MKKYILLSPILVLFLIGCATIPKNASVLNQKVSEGIERNQTETEKIRGLQ